jgi:hypothetical protein
MVVNNQQMQMGEDRPVNINEMDFAFLSENDPAVEPQNAAINMKKNLTPEEQKEIAGLVPYVERFFVLNFKAETGDYPPEPVMEPKGGGGITIDEYRGMSNEDRLANSTEGQEVSLNLKPKSSFDRSPSELPQALPVEAPEMEQAAQQPEQEPVEQPQESPVKEPPMMQEGGDVEEEKPQQESKEPVPVGPVGEIDVEGKDRSGVADDIPVKADGFVLSRGAVIANGKMYIKEVIQDAIDNLKEKGIELDTSETPEKAEDILISNGEVIIPDIIAQEIGYKRLEKMNKRGEELTEKLIAEYEAGQQQQPQPQIKAPFEQAPKKTAFKGAKQSFS